MRTQCWGGLNRKLAGFGIVQDPDEGCSVKHIGGSDIKAQTIASYGHYRLLFAHGRQLLHITRTICSHRSR